jgi:hypothetical protein
MRTKNHKNNDTTTINIGIILSAHFTQVTEKLRQQARYWNS